MKAKKKRALDAPVRKMRKNMARNCSGATVKVRSVVCLRIIDLAHKSYC